MRISPRRLAIIAGTVLTILALWGGAGLLEAKEKTPQLSPNDPTVRLYSLLDSKYNGKLEDFCLLADVVSDPKNPGQSEQHVLRIEYNKDRAFGKLYYVTDPALACERLARGAYGLGAFLNAPSVAEVRAIADLGETMPQKSTYFYPKLITGLVFDALGD